MRAGRKQVFWGVAALAILGLAGSYAGRARASAKQAPADRTANAMSTGGDEKVVRQTLKNGLHVEVIVPDKLAPVAMPW